MPLQMRIGRDTGDRQSGRIMSRSDRVETDCRTGKGRLVQTDIRSVQEEFFLFVIRAGFRLLWEQPGG